MNIVSIDRPGNKEPIKVGSGYPLLLIAGPCVLESEALAREVAAALKEMAERLSIPLVFKSSFDKANRTSLDSFRGPGLEEGLKILSDIRHDFDLPVVSDIHESYQVAEASAVLDVLQMPEVKRQLTSKRDSLFLHGIWQMRSTRSMHQGIRI